MNREIKYLLYIFPHYIGFKIIKVRIIERDFDYVFVRPYDHHGMPDDTPFAVKRCDRHELFNTPAEAMEKLKDQLQKVIEHINAANVNLMGNGVTFFPDVLVQ